MTLRILLAALALFAAAQLVPVDRSNPAVETSIVVPDDVRAVLERSCYDCHSNQTAWPWYSRIAPVSWLVAHDVHEAREHMNFDTWNRYDAEEQAELRHEIWEEVEEGEMPLPVYLILHGDAELAEADRQLLRAWSEAGEAGGGAD